MQITVATPADRAEVMDLVSQVWTDDYVPDFWDEWVNRPEAGIPLVARIADRLVGIAYVHLLSPEVAWLQALRVAKSARRQGVGTALSQAARAHAKQRGCRVARLLVDMDNHASASMTEQAGFSQVLRLYKLQKEVQLTDGPPAIKPAAELLPTLLQLAEQHGHTYWQSDWETHDLSLAVLQQAAQRGCLRVPAGSETLALADVSIYDDSYDISQPLGESAALLCLMRGLEAEAKSLGKKQLDVFLPEQSAALPLLLATGEYRLLENDGNTIWEYQL